METKIICTDVIECTRTIDQSPTRQIVQVFTEIINATQKISFEPLEFIKHRTFRSRKQSFHSRNLICLKTCICTSQNLFTRQERIIISVFQKRKIRLLRVYQGSIIGTNVACWEDFSNIPGLYFFFDLAILGHQTQLSC